MGHFPAQHFKSWLPRIKFVYIYENHKQNIDEWRWQCACANIQIATHGMGMLGPVRQSSHISKL